MEKDCAWSYLPNTQCRKRYNPTKGHFYSTTSHWKLPYQTAVPSQSESSSRTIAMWCPTLWTALLYNHKNSQGRILLFKSSTRMQWDKDNLSKPTFFPVIGADWVFPYYVSVSNRLLAHDLGTHPFVSFNMHTNCLQRKDVIGKFPTVMECVPNP